VSGGSLAALLIVVAGILPESGVLAATVFGVAATTVSLVVLLRSLHGSFTWSASGPKRIER
jgi:hypothetical protein